MKVMKKYIALGILASLSGTLVGQAFGEAGILIHSHGMLNSDGTVLLDQFQGSRTVANPLTQERWSIYFEYVDEEWYEDDASKETWSTVYRRDKNGQHITSTEVDWTQFSGIKLDPLRNIAWVFDRSDYSLWVYDENMTLIDRVFGFEDLGASDDYLINPIDGSPWVYMNGVIGPLDANGVQHPVTDYIEELHSFAIKPADESCWVASKETVTKYLNDGTIAFQTTLDYAGNISINIADDSCWVAGKQNITKIDASGNILFEIPADWISSAVVDPLDGSVWIGGYSEELRRFSAEGELLLETDVYGEPKQIINGTLQLGFSALEHANSQNRLWADEGLVDLKPNNRIGHRAQWVFTHLGNGYAEIVNRKTGELLRATNNGESVRMDTATSNKAQWELIRHKSGAYFHLKNKHFGTYLRGHDERGLQLEKTNNPGPNFRWQTAEKQ